MTIESTSLLVNHQLKDFISQNPGSKLPEDVAVEHTTDLKHAILNSSEDEVLGSVATLVRVLELAPQSDRFVDLLDRQFFKSIFDTFVVADITDESYRNFLRVLLLFLSGSMFTTRQSTSFNALLYEAYSNEPLLAILTDKLDSEDLRMSSAVIDFVSKLVFREAEQNKPEFLPITYKILKVLGFFTKCNRMSEDPRFEQPLASYFRDCIISTNMAQSKLRDLQLVKDTETTKVLVTELLEVLESALYSTGRSLTKQDLFKKDFGENPESYILSKFSALAATDLLVFLKDKNITFKKLYHDHLIFAEGNELFPVGEMGLAVSSLLADVARGTLCPNLNGRLNSTKDMYRVLMTQSLHFWKTSKAERSDAKVIVALLENLLEYAETLAVTGNPLNETLDAMTELSYEEVRKFQLDRIKSERAKEWEVPTKPFRNYLSDQVFEFVKEQHFLQLSKGSWVYAEDPTHTTKAPRSYFMLLSPNSQSIVYKKFERSSIVRPNIDEDGTTLDISQISRIECTLLQSKNVTPSNKRLISLSGNVAYERIVLYNKAKKPIFQFFTDSKDTLWSDGLKMFAKTRDELSAGTRKQIAALERIRGGVQLLDLAATDRLIHQKVAGNVVYQQEKLTAIAADFHYNSIQ